MLTHLSGQLGPMRGSMSAAVLQASVGPLLKPFPVALPSEPGKQSHPHSVVAYIYANTSFSR